MKKNYIFTNRVLCAVLVLLFSSTSIAQIDNCGTGAPLINVNTSCVNTSYTIPATFTNDGPAPCNGTSYRDGWFRFTTDATTTSISIQGTSDRQLGLAIYTACGALYSACTVPGTTAATLNTTVTPSTTYYLRVMRTNNANNNSMVGNICITKVISSNANDECSTAITLPVNTSCTYATYTNVGATASSGIPAPGCANYVDDDVWFVVTVPANGVLIVDMQSGGITDSGMALYSGTCGALSLLECDDDDSLNGLMSSITRTGLTPGSQVYIRVWEYGGDANGTFGICVSTYTGYCPATSTTTGYSIVNFSTSAGISNISNLNSGFSAGGYGNFTSMSASQSAGASVNFNSSFNGTNTFGFNIWIDWNNDNDFDDAGEKVYASGAYVNPAAGSFTVPLGTPTGNYRMRIRANYLSTDPSACGSIDYGETEDYAFTVATPPPCSGFPSNIVANVTSNSTASISWTAASPAPANGYQLWYSTSATSPTGTTTPNASTAGTITTANLTGLAAGATYYVWVRANCGGALGQGFWVGPITFFIPTCGIGNSQGTTTLGCPSVLSGGLGLNGADPAPINCTGASCVNLEATYLQLGQTTSYTVESIPYAPPYQFSCLKNPVSVNDDDVWSPVVNLPFNFCFFGNTYNQCLISSNGVVTFDLTNNTAGGYSTWSFANDLPSTSLFRNSIFGVYHDIDPTLSGEVGWELITLNTGCRALVASWNNIPMYSTACSSQRYTGMIVFYENTNIIDVYIQNKTVCASWNTGNAVVGIQNAAGTQAFVPPNRNSLSPDWTVTNEAWRFVPSGASITSIKWFQGSGTSGPVVGTTDVINVCPTINTTYTAEVTYTLCNGITLVETEETNVTVNAGKLWNGSAGNNNWNTATNWTPNGVPTAATCVTIPTGSPTCIISGSAFNAYAYSLTVQNGGTLRLNSGNNLTVTDFVHVNTGGTFNIYDSANLLQINNVNNTGIVNMERITKPMYRYDYTYWNSPMTLASNYTLGNLSPNTQPDKYYSWMPFVGAGTGNWAQESVATIMDPRKGYIIRAPQTYSISPSTKVPYTGNFIGTPNNGNFTAPVSRGTLGAGIWDDKWNLLGNPYPSALSAASFLNAAANTPVLDGTIYFWTHNTAPNATFPDPFYYDFQINYSAADYATWNKLGGVGTMASSGGPAPNGYIAAGQSFFTRSLVQSGNATFTNAMRSSVNNSQFFRNVNSDFGKTEQEPDPEESEDFEKHRIWLNMTNDAGAFSQILVGYAQGATLDWDRGLDGLRFGSTSTALYSMLGEDYLVTQGRPIPFDVNDQVPLGIYATSGINYSIRIDHFDGLFDSQNIYIEDKELDIIHDLKQNPYDFTTLTGRFNERFILRYTTDALNVSEASTNGFTAFVFDNILQIRASQPIAEVTVYDVTGKRLQTFTPSGDGLDCQWNFNYAQGVYMAKVKFENGLVESRKLMNR
ncbi:MAG: T9SS type A sorting domain-containing protein [Flavobacterium sp.]|uniref:T9SS type A sorting domain-containing protein n=1 Tax=Flavobacterium sp. TaxID=239 RepID=UPI0012160467|nr:GEVED domain-containing protein [Flavobacterium sp.]RZJ65650.1 MAG: T9SS type A sorting domain-containing protein [Flavobacterium sp.]